MTHVSSSLTHLSNDELLSHVQRLSATERGATARLVAALAELDARGLHLAAGCSSLFTYCTQVLRLSEHAAYGRIEAARASRRFPVVLELFECGDVTLTTITLLARHLTADNHRALLDEARGKSRREVERLVASLQPRPEAPSSIRKLPDPRMARMLPVDSLAAGAQPPSPETAGPPIVTAAADPTPTPATAVTSSRPAILPLAPERYRIHITVSAATHDRLRRAQDLMRHTVPDGDPAVIVGRALTLLVDMLERRRFAAAARGCATVDRPQGDVRRTRYISAAIRRAVWKRDDGQCAFMGTHGRCTERGTLEFHHVQPYAAGGVTSADNLQLRCRAHNQYDAEQFFGPTVDRIGA
jgi:hypothetical protein